MASSEVIQELLRQSFLERQQPSVGAASIQQIMQGILQGIQLYDTVKSLGLKHGGEVKTQIPGQQGTPAIPSEVSLRAGTAFTPRTLPTGGLQFTKLTPEEETEFQKQYKTIALKQGINLNPDDPEHFYDYRAAFKAGQLKPDQIGHFPSKFKLPGHPRTIVDGINTITDEVIPPTTALPIQQQGVFPSIPGTADIPPQTITGRYPGSAEADILQSLQNLPELQQRFATAKDLGNIRPTLLEQKTVAQATQMKNRIANANSQLRLLEERVRLAKTKSEKENLASNLNALSNSLLPTMLLTAQGDTSIEDQNALSDLLTRMELVKERMQPLPGLPKNPPKEETPEPTPKPTLKPEEKKPPLLERFKNLFKSTKAYKSKEEVQTAYLNGEIDREEFVQTLKDHMKEWQLTE